MVGPSDYTLKRLAYTKQQSFRSRWIAADKDTPLVEGNRFSNLLSILIRFRMQRTMKDR
ncbi:hypothetical protein F4801DRAFT_571552 [Xylaria longipes]|nr:hypothetical protein F4801DRAFT_571552 [Xylaria longipes]